MNILDHVVAIAALVTSITIAVFLACVFFSLMKDLITEIKSKGIRVSLQERYSNLSQSEAMNISDKVNKGAL